MFKDISVDALMPLEMAEKAETMGVRKAALSFWKLFALSVLAGAFVASGSHVRYEHCRRIIRSALWGGTNAYRHDVLHGFDLDSGGWC